MFLATGSIPPLKSEGISKRNEAPLSFVLSSVEGCASVMKLMAIVLVPKRWFDGLTTNGLGQVGWLAKPFVHGMMRTESASNPGILRGQDPEFSASMRTAAGFSIA